MIAASLGSFGIVTATAILPNVISLSAAINACERDLQWQQALGLLALMQQTLFRLAFILLSRDQCSCEGSALAAGIGSSGGDAADLCSAWRLFLLSRVHCL